MDQTLKDQIISIIDETDDMTIATVRDDGFPQATTVSFMNDGLTIYFGTSAESQKAANITKSDKVSLTINRPYEDWSEIVGLSIGAKASRVTDPEEFETVVQLMFKKFPQIPDYTPTDNSVELAIFRIDPVVISLLDYRQGFGHTELVKV
jgi:general stress protein 26